MFTMLYNVDDSSLSGRISEAEMKSKKKNSQIILYEIIII